MQKIQTFLYVFKNSAISPKYYKDILQTNMRFSVKYYGVLSMTLILIVSTALTLKTYKPINEGVEKIISQTNSLIPQDLVLTIKDGQAAINQPEPYVIPFPKELKHNATEFNSRPSTEYENLIVFDSNGTLESFDSYKTVVLVNKFNIIALSSNGKIEIYPLKETPDTVINKAMIDNAINYAQKWLVIVHPIIFVAWIMIISLTLFLYRPIYLLLVALIGLILGKIFRAEYTFEKWYQIALHTMTLPLILWAISIFISFGSTFIPWFILLHVTYICIVSYQLGKESSS